MLRRIRVIPVLLLHKSGLVKSVKFQNYKYVGDPINAVKIFNDKGADEIVILDINSTAGGKGPNFSQIQQITGEAFMPLAYGGGIQTLDHIKNLITSGVEKAVLNTAAVKNPHLIRQAAEWAGSQSVVVSIDVKKNFWGRYKVYCENGRKNSGYDPVDFAKAVQSFGAGEIFLNSIDRDGTFGGYDLAIINAVASAVTIPVVALGGAAKLDDFASAINCGASAVAAASMFVFQGLHRAVLISYPSEKELKGLAV